MLLVELLVVLNDIAGVGCLGSLKVWKAQARESCGKFLPYGVK